MRIGIEAQRIFRKKKGGMDVVALETIKNLQKIDKNNEYIIYASQDEDTGYCIEETKNFKIKYIKGLSYVDWEQIWLPLQAQKDKLDVLHCTSNTAPLWGAIPKIITVHDIIYLEKQSWPANANAYQRLGNYYRSVIVPMGVKAAEQIVTVSGFEKANIINRFKLDDSKVEVISNGVNNVFRRVTDADALNKVIKKYNLPGSYILFMGNTEPRKNMRNMLKAYAILVAKQSNAPDLVITNVDREYLNKILEEIGEKWIEQKIALTGYADFADLPALYSLSEFFAYPSLREGFGLPIVEAMACGTPVITSNVSSMPEIAGDAALLVDPHTPAGIAEAMNRYVSNPGLKNAKIQAGLKRYKMYTWEASAKKLVNIYDSFAFNQYSKKVAVNLI